MPNYAVLSCSTNVTSCVKEVHGVRVLVCPGGVVPGYRLSVFPWSRDKGRLEGMTILLNLTATPLASSKVSLEVPFMTECLLYSYKGVTSYSFTELGTCDNCRDNLTLF